MKINNLQYLVNSIVELSLVNQVVCDQRRELETRIEELEEVITKKDKVYKELIATREDRIKELESLEVFNSSATCESCGSDLDLGACECGRYEK